MTPAEQARATAVPTQNLQAWEAYQLGKQRMAKRTSADLADAERFFREAIDLDPQFALAYVGLADSLTLQFGYSGAPKESGLRNAEKAVTEALELDPTLAEAWASAGLIAYYRGNTIAANRCSDAQSNSIQTTHLRVTGTAAYWSSVGRLDEALAQVQRAAELDPLSAMIKVNLAGVWRVKAAFTKLKRPTGRPSRWIRRRPVVLGPRESECVCIRPLRGRRAIGREGDATGFGQPAGLLRPRAACISILAKTAKLFEGIANAANRWPDDA